MRNIRNSHQYIARLQQALKRELGLQLALDGIMSARTRRALRKFQRQKGLGPKEFERLATQRALIVTRNDDNEFESNESPEQELQQSGQTQTNLSAQYQDLLAKIRGQLERRFRSPNDPQLLDRRQKLVEIFKLVPPRFARTLHDQLQNQADPLSRLFRGALAPITCTVLLRVLQKTIASAPVPPGEPGPLQPDLQTVILDLLARGRPLPAALEPDFREAANRFISLTVQSVFVGNLKSAEAETVICVLQRLLSGTPDAIVILRERCEIDQLMRYPGQICFKLLDDFPLIHGSMPRMKSLPFFGLSTMIN